MLCLRNRSSRPKVFCKKDVLKNFTKFTGKHFCQSLFFNKAAGKKRLRRMCFPVNFVRFLRTPFLQNNSGGLLLTKDLPSISLISNEQLLCYQYLYMLHHHSFLVPRNILITLWKWWIATWMLVQEKKNYVIYFNRHKENLQSMYPFIKD